MVSRVSLIFWRWVVVFHDGLHDARNKVQEAEADRFLTWLDEPTQVIPAMKKLANAEPFTDND